MATETHANLQMSIFSPIAVPIGISSALPGAFCQAYYIHRCWAVSDFSSTKRTIIHLPVQLSRNWFFLIPSISTLLLSLGSSIALVIIPDFLPSQRHSNLRFRHGVPPRLQGEYSMAYKLLRIQLLFPWHLLLLVTSGSPPSVCPAPPVST